MLVVMKNDATEAQVQSVIKEIEKMGYRGVPMPGAIRTAICILGNRGPIEAAQLLALDGVKLGTRTKVVVLSAKEESLINVVRMLPPGEAGKVLIWAQQLADLAGGRHVDWSDSWSDDDLRDATAASLERFEKQEREEH